jgi:archaellum component FlaD/FlaE
MTTDTGIDTTALNMAKRLSAFPASIREEVIEVVAEVVAFLTQAHTFLEGVAAPKGTTEAEEAQQGEIEEHILMLLYSFMRLRTQPIRHRYIAMVESREQTSRRKQGRRKGKG